MRAAAMLLLGLICSVCLAADGDVVFEDDFAAPKLSPEWEVTQGKWRVDEGQLTNGQPASGSAFAGQMTWDDYTFETRFKTVQPGPKPWSVARVLFRYQDRGNCYYLVLHQSGLLELGKE